VIRIESLEKRFGKLTVLRGLNLELEAGKVTAVLGPNGAGKTTLIKSILGLVRPDAGRILLGGEAVSPDGAYRARIGYMPQIPRYPENLTVSEIFAMLKDLRGRTEDLDTDLVEAFDLDAQLDKPFKTLSGGNRQRVSAALAFLFCPEVLILDEPTAGLDPLASSTLKDKVVSERKRGRTVLLTSHVMSEVEEMADRVVYLLDGAVHLDESVPQLLAASGEPNLERALARMMIRVVA
jgi:Cu-processing system ATP-binding protein